MANIRRRLAVSTAAAMLLGTGVVLFSTEPALAHGANIAPGSRTYLCFQNGGGAGDIKPTNPACAAAVASSTTQPLWDWYGVLRSDGAGRMAGFIDDGSLCSGGNPKYADYDAPRADWPLTRLTGGAKWTFRYNAWAPHPGQFRLFVTKDGFDPTQPLKWSDLESAPFSTWDETVPNAAGEYFWDVTLPNKTGRHIIYSVWARTDSKETFYNCSDVVFDGGKGEVDYNPKVDTTSPTKTTSTTKTSSTTTTSTTTSSSGGATSCAATYTVSDEWNKGFQAKLTVKNTGSAELSSWKAAWTYADGQKVTQFTGAKVVQSNKNVVVTPTKSSGALAAGASLTASITGTWKGTNSVPSVTCTPAGVKTTKTKTTKVKTTKTKSTKCKNAKKCTTTTKPPTTSTGPTTTTTTTTTKPTPTVTGALLNDGFESQAGGALGGGWTSFARSCPGQGTATIDTTTAHSGSKSLKITGVAGYCNHIMAKAPVNPSSAGSTFFVRAYIKHTTALPPSHTTFIDMTDANDNGKSLRIGGQNSALQWNRESDDATLPAQSPTGVALSKPLPTGDWQCFEFSVDSSGKAMTWLNGTEVAGLTADGVKTSNVDDQWFNKSWSPKITEIGFGWESYGDGADTLWYDDIAIGSSRIGC
ncbi:MAG: lytic polysaccharide monooxygenase [Kineosporiaceae bacterium]